MQTVELESLSYKNLVVRVSSALADLTRHVDANVSKTDLRAELEAGIVCLTHLALRAAPADRESVRMLSSDLHELYHYVAVNDGETVALKSPSPTSQHL